MDFAEKKTEEDLQKNKWLQVATCMYEDNLYT